MSFKTLSVSIPLRGIEQATRSFCDGELMKRIVSIPLRGIEQATRRSWYPPGRYYRGQVSIPLRGIEQETLPPSRVMLGHYKQFPSPCGELSRQLSLGGIFLCKQICCFHPLAGN